MWFLEDVLACIRKVAYLKICLEHCNQDQTVFFYTYEHVKRSLSQLWHPIEINL
jgi:hypothetical protein